MKHRNLINSMFEEGFQPYFDNSGKLGYESEETHLEAESEFELMLNQFPELLKQVKSLSYCFGELLNHRESIPTRLGWDQEKLEEWKKELDELVIKAEGK